MDYRERVRLAYIVGIALGDGNLSNPNGRAVRLRITCDAKYGMLAKEITSSLKALLPGNTVSIIGRKETFSLIRDDLHLMKV